MIAESRQAVVDKGAVTAMSVDRRLIRKIACESNRWLHPLLNTSANYLLAGTLKDIKFAIFELCHVYSWLGKRLTSLMTLVVYLNFFISSTVGCRSSRTLSTCYKRFQLLQCAYACKDHICERITFYHLHPAWCVLKKLISFLVVKCHESKKKVSTL